MAADKPVNDIKARLLESQNQRDSRVKGLWKELDPQDKGELDFKGLQKGLRRIDHREFLPRSVLLVATCSYSYRPAEPDTNPPLPIL